ncbi:ATP-binding protein [Antarctobacter jejuensis]|uniref:ATP-binding protein n=1 Tax=Antarctobacter jejuensis TaxID=1439938 RepID=UPI003FD6B2B4
MVEPRSKNLSDFLAKAIRRLQVQFILLAIFIVMPLVVYVVWHTLEERDHALKAQTAEARSLAEDLVKAQHALVEDTRKLLMTVSISPVARDPAAPECGQYLADLLSIEPGYANFGVARDDGELLCSALPLPSRVNVVDRQYLRRAIQERIFNVGTSQLSSADGQKTISFAYPVPGSEDAEQPAGATLAFLSFDWWTSALAAAELPPGSVARVFDAEGTLLAQYPVRAGLAEKSIVEVASIDPQLSTDTSLFTGPDGVRRVFDYRALLELNGTSVLTMTIGIPVNAGIAEANTHGLVHLALLAVAAFGIWVLASRGFKRSFLMPMRVAQAELMLLEGNADTKDGLPASMQNAHPEVAQFVRSARDLMQRGQFAEDAERRTSQQMSALLSALPDLFFHLNGEGRTLNFHSGDRSNLMMSPDDFLGRRMQDLLPDEASSLFLQHLGQVRKSRELAVWEYQLDIRGKVKDFEARLCPVEDSDDVLLVVRDITASRQSERQRVEAEGQLQAVMQNIRGAVFTITVPADWAGPGPDDTVRFINRDAALGIWEIEPEVLEANPAAGWQLCDDQDLLTALNDELTASVVEARPWHATWSITTPSGRKKWLEGYGNSTRLEDGSTHMVCMVFDATEAALKDQELERQKDLNHQAQKQKAIGQLTGGVAHDFNNLLAVIMGNLELLRDEESDPEKIAWIDSGINATRRGADLTRSMLAFARKARLEPKPIKLNALVAETRNWAGRILPENIEIQTSLLADLWEIEADNSSTEAALLNLILNARDAMSDGGKLTIETANVRIEQGYLDTRRVEIKPGRYVMLAVSDTGHGIASEDLPRIFEPFYTTKPPGSGSGLGLSMIQGFMEQSGGTVQVYSEAGVGTTFKLYFPSKQRLQEPHSHLVSSEAPDLGGAAKILLVEDDDEVRSVLAKTVEKGGHRVTVAASGDKALLLFQANPDFDLVVTDIVMPGKLQGTGLSKALRQLRPDLPVVFMSGYASEATVHGNGLRPEDIRLMKPVQRSDLLAAIAKALQK